MEPLAIARDFCGDFLDQPLVVGFDILLMGQHRVDYIEGADIEADQEHKVMHTVLELGATPPYSHQPTLLPVLTFHLVLSGKMY